LVRYDGHSPKIDLPRRGEEEERRRRVVELLLSIPTHKATRDDGISAKLLRIAAPAILPTLIVYRSKNYFLPRSHWSPVNPEEHKQRNPLLVKPV